MTRRQTLTSSEAAHALGLNPRSLARWARAHGVTPLRRQRIGRSWVTVWARTDLTEATRESTQLDADPAAC